jgi:hypothetical protein
MPRALSERTFDELAADLEKRPDSLPYLQASAELHIRQIKALLEATTVVRYRRCDFRNRVHALCDFRLHERDTAFLNGHLSFTRSATSVSFDGDFAWLGKKRGCIDVHQS